MAGCVCLRRPLPCLMQSDNSNDNSSKTPFDQPLSVAVGTEYELDWSLFPGLENWKPENAALQITNRISNTRQQQQQPTPVTTRRTSNRINENIHRSTLTQRLHHQNIPTTMVDNHRQPQVLPLRESNINLGYTSVNTTPTRRTRKYAHRGGVTKKVDSQKVEKKTGECACPMCHRLGTTDVTDATRVLDILGGVDKRLYDFGNEMESFSAYLAATSHHQSDVMRVEATSQACLPGSPARNVQGQAVISRSSTRNAQGQMGIPGSPVRPQPQPHQAVHHRTSQRNNAYATRSSTWLDNQNTPQCMHENQNIHFTPQCMHENQNIHFTPQCMSENQNIHFTPQCMSENQNIHYTPQCMSESPYSTPRSIMEGWTDAPMNNSPVYMLPHQQQFLTPSATVGVSQMVDMSMGRYPYLNVQESRDYRLPVKRKLNAVDLALHEEISWDLKRRKPQPSYFGGHVNVRDSGTPVLRQVCRGY